MHKYFLVFKNENTVHFQIHSTKPILPWHQNWTEAQPLPETKQKWNSKSVFRKNIHGKNYKILLGLIWVYENKDIHSGQGFRNCSYKEINKYNHIDRVRTNI